MIFVATIVDHVVRLISEPLPPTPPLLPWELVTWGREQVSEQSHNSSVYGSPCLPEAPTTNYLPPPFYPGMRTLEMKPWLGKSVEKIQKLFNVNALSLDCSGDKISNQCQQN